MLQVVIFGCFMCFTHMLQVHVPNVESIFIRMLHSNIFHVASVSCCSAEGERSGCAARRGLADGGAGGWQTVVLWSGCAGGVLVLSSSS